MYVFMYECMYVCMNDSDFGFGFDTTTQAAKVCLKADPNLKKKVQESGVSVIV